jgi:diguanylate cyclase (GGDEF)-like protein
LKPIHQAADRDYVGITSKSVAPRPALESAICFLLCQQFLDLFEHSPAKNLPLRKAFTRPNDWPPTDRRAAKRLCPYGLQTAFMVASIFSVALLFAGQQATSESSRALLQLRTINTVREAHDLSNKEAARGYPIHLRAVVTFLHSTGVEAGPTGMFVQDATGGIFVFFSQGAFGELQPGALVDLRGVTGPGDYAPIVSLRDLRVIGFPGLPTNPHRPSLARLLSSAEDAEWVELEGVVHSVVEEKNWVNLQLTMVDGPITVSMVQEAGTVYSGLVDAKVRLRGNAGASFDVTRTHMIGIRLFCPNLSAVQVVNPPPSDPFQLPTLRIDKLLQWEQAPLLAHRVHVQGRVTFQWPGSSVCIQDATQGICAETAQNTRLRNGELIDVAGFVRVEGSAPMLDDAVFRSAGSSADAPVKAVPVTVDEVLAGGHDSGVIDIDGQLLSRDLSSSDTTLLINSGKFIFKAILPQALSGPESKAWENGSLLRVTGVASVQIDAQRSELGLGTAVPKTFRVLLRSPADVVVVKRPSWWTPSHTMIVLAVALAGTLVVLGWVIVLRKRLRESEERFRHMALHDALTGLATRLLLQDRMRIAVKSARRHRTGIALLIVDMDEFKGINDAFGHPAGDEVLRVTADRLLQTVRSSDTVARLGGDEFVVLLSGVSDSRTVEAVATNIVKKLARPIFFEGREMPVSASVGVSESSSEELDEDDLIKNADAALYCAKERGRGRYEVFNVALLPQP